MSAKINFLIFILSILFSSCFLSELNDDRELIDKSEFDFEFVNGTTDVKAKKVLIKASYEGVNHESLQPGTVSWFSSNDKIEFDSFLKRQESEIFSEAKLILDGISKDYSFGICLERNNITQCYESTEKLVTKTAWPDAVVVYPSSKYFSHQEDESQIKLSVDYTSNLGGISSDMKITPTLKFVKSQENVPNTIAYISPIEITLPKPNSDSVNFNFTYIGDSLSLTTEKTEMVIDFEMVDSKGVLSGVEIETIFINYKT